MKSPDELDRVVCPQGGGPREPDRVWDGAKGPGGKPRRYGVLKQHSHGWPGDRCDYSGHVVPVTREEKKDVP